LWELEHGIIGRKKNNVVRPNTEIVSEWVWFESQICREVFSENPREQGILYV